MNYAKALFCRIKNFLFYEPPVPETATANIWKTTTTHGPAAMPFGMHTWQADPVADRGMFEELNPTQMIPKITEDTFAPRYATAFAKLSGAPSDQAFKDEATKAVLYGDVNTTVVALLEYVARHPVAV